MAFCSSFNSRVFHHHIMFFATILGPNGPVRHCLSQKTWSVRVFEETSVAFEKSSIFELLRGDFELLRVDFELVLEDLNLLRGDFEVCGEDIDLLRGDCDRYFEDLERLCGDAERFCGESESFLANDATLLSGDLGQVRTLNVFEEISRVVEEMLSALEENDVSCCYGIRTEVRMVGAYDIAKRIKKKNCYTDGFRLVNTDNLSFLLH